MKTLMMLIALMLSCGMARAADVTFARVNAYGDTVEDLAMLGMAHERTFRWQPAG